MPITAADAGPVETLRGRVLDYLAERRRKGPFRVIDVGGRYNPWADAVTDAYVDLFPTAAGEEKRVYVGNICTEEVWDDIARAAERDGPFDFSICTHVLEDVRDPFFVARRLARISKAGFVSVPTKHSELSNVESRFYLGYCHHRWIFTVQGVDDERRMIGVGKMPVVGYFNNRFRPLLKLVHLFGSWTVGAKINRRLGVFPGGGRPGWIDRGLVGHDRELAVWWEGELPLEPLADDYSGGTCLHLADLYTDAIRDGI